MKTNVKQKPAANQPYSMPVDICGVEYAVTVLTEESYAARRLSAWSPCSVDHDAREICLSTSIRPADRGRWLERAVNDIWTVFQTAFVQSN